jgi:NitT/TauT family transport system substrate-binding protein
MGAARSDSGGHPLRVATTRRAAWRGHRAGWLGLAASALLLAGCRSVFPETITVPVSLWPGYEFFPLAREQGLDRREGLRLDLPAFANPQDIVLAYLRGDVQIAQLTTVEAVDLCNRVPKRCPVVVLVLDESRGGDQVVVNRSLASIADLQGRPVAITPSTLGPYVLSQALRRHGLSLMDVQLRPMPLESMAAALNSGTVDAAALFPPFSDQAMAGGKVRPLFTSREIPGEIFDILVVDPQVINARRSALVRLLRAWQAAHDALQRNPETALAVMARRQEISVDAFRASLDGLVFLSLQQQQPLFEPKGLLERNLRDLREVQSQLGLLPADAPLPPVDGSLIRAAVQPR